MRRTTATACLETPLGPVQLIADDVQLLGVRLPGRSAPPAWVAAGDHPVLAMAAAQLSQWFAGTRDSFALPLAPLPGEGERLRAAIAAIPYGETRTYGAVADSCGSVARAVGQACRTNAFPILIPCHRVVSAAGPDYYSAGNGPRTKSWLLDFEYARLPDEKRTRLI